jgi:hypothetical protein
MTKRTRRLLQRRKDAKGSFSCGLGIFATWRETPVCFFLFAALLAAGMLQAQPVNESLYRAMKWHSIGPYRGGRVTAVAGVTSQPMVYYLGATGGGVWKTENAGITWRPISDGFFHTGSVGAIVMAESNPNVVYVGMGEACLRANISHGDGVYKSVDAGKTWINVGLADTRQICKVRVDPRDPDLVYVAAVGHPYGPNEERGVFRSGNGGKTWGEILYVNDKTGAVDLSLDPHNSRVLYASTWQVLRTPCSNGTCAIRTRTELKAAPSWRAAICAGRSPFRESIGSSSPWAVSPRARSSKSRRIPGWPRPWRTTKSNSIC